MPLFLVTIVVSCRAYFLPARKRQEALRLSPRRGLHDRRTDSLDVEAQFSAESEVGGAENYKDYNLQPSAVGFVSGEGGGLVQAEAHASSGSQYGEGLQYNAGNSINEYGVDDPGEIIYENHYGQLPPSPSSELLLDQTDQGLGIVQADDTAQSTAEIQFGDTSQYSVEAQADNIIKSNLEFTEGAKSNPESQVDSSGQDIGGAQQGEGAKTNYGTVPSRPNTSNGANQYSGITSMNAPTASQTKLPWNNENGKYGANRPIGTPQYGGNSYSAPQFLPGSSHKPYAGSYNYNGGSYNAGSYNGGSYNGGSYNGGSYNGGPYNGLTTGYVSNNKLPPNGVPPNGVPSNGVPPNGLLYGGATGYGGLNQGSVPNQYVGNVYSSGPQAAPLNQGNGYSPYGTLGGFNSSKFGNSQYSTAESVGYSKPASNYGVPVSSHRAPPTNTGKQFNRDQYQKLNQNILSTQGRSPYSLINYNAEGLEPGTENTNGQDGIISSGGTPTNVIGNDLIKYQEQADSKVLSNSAQSSKIDVSGQVNEGSKYSGEIYSNPAQAQEEGKTITRAHYGKERQSNSEVKQGIDTQYPKLDKYSKANKYATQSQDVRSRGVKRNRSKKVRYSQEPSYVTTTLNKLITEAPQNEDIPTVDAIEARFKPNYPHHDYGYEHQRSPRWHHG